MSTRALGRDVVPGPHDRRHPPPGWPACAARRCGCPHVVPAAAANLARFSPPPQHGAVHRNAGESMTVVHQHRVRYHEVDPQGFMFNSRYLEIADVAMAEFFRSLGWSYTALNDEGMDPSVATTTLRFATPARFDDLLDVSVWCPRVGTSSFDLDMTMCRDDLEVATVHLVYVNVDASLACSRPIPPTIASALTAKGVLR
jgi:acyl-CoA thioester hydrolase